MSNQATLHDSQSMQLRLLLRAHFRQPKVRLITEAGKALLGLGKSLGKNASGNLSKSLGQMSKRELAMSLAPDLMFGAIYGASTPGDLTDKVIAGVGSGLGGAVGGVGLRGALGVQNPMLGLGIDYLGSIGGDIGGQALSDNVLRVKGGGMTPLERLQEEQYQQIKAEAKQEAIREIIARQYQ